MYHFEDDHKVFSVTRLSKVGIQYNLGNLAMH
jgi:hypothetical protein